MKSGLNYYRRDYGYARLFTRAELAKQDTELLNLIRNGAARGDRQDDWLAQSYTWAIKRVIPRRRGMYHG